MRARAMILRAASTGRSCAAEPHAHAGRGRYRVGENLNVDVIAGLSHADVADFMVKAWPAISTRADVDISY